MFPWNGYGIYLRTVQNSRNAVLIILNDGLNKLNLILMLGSHNFYGVEDYTSTSCTENRPAFLLFNKADELQGFGFTVNGNAPKSKYFEHPPNAAISVSLELYKHNA